jgi:hypothetical protein
MNHTFRNATLRLAAADVLAGDDGRGEMWLELTEPPGGQPWQFNTVGDPDKWHMWGVVIEWRGENVHLVYGDYSGGFGGIIKPDLTSEEDPLPTDEEIACTTHFLDSMAHFSNSDEE